MKKGDEKKTPKKEESKDINTEKRILTLEDSISFYSDESIPRRYRNPISQRWDDTTWM